MPLQPTPTNSNFESKITHNFIKAGLESNRIVALYKAIGVIATSSILIVTHTTTGLLKSVVFLSQGDLENATSEITQGLSKSTHSIVTIFQVTIVALYGLAVGAKAYQGMNLPTDNKTASPEDLKPKEPLQEGDKIQTLLEPLIKQLQAKLGAMQKEFEAQKLTYSLLEKAHQSQIEDLKRRHSENLSQLKATHTQELHQKNDQHSSALENLKHENTQLETNHRVASQALESSHKEAVAALESKQKQIESAYAKQLNDLEQKIDALEKACSLALESFQTQTNQVKEEHAKQLETLESNHQQALQEEQAKAHHLEAQYKEAIEHKEALQALVEELMDDRSKSGHQIDTVIAALTKHVDSFVKQASQDTPENPEKPSAENIDSEQSSDLDRSLKLLQKMMDSSTPQQKPQLSLEQHSPFDPPTEGNFAQNLELERLSNSFEKLTGLFIKNIDTQLSLEERKQLGLDTFPIENSDMDQKLKFLKTMLDSSPKEEEVSVLPGQNGSINSPAEGNSDSNPTNKMPDLDIQLEDATKHNPFELTAHSSSRKPLFKDSLGSKPNIQKGKSTSTQAPLVDSNRAKISKNPPQPFMQLSKIPTENSVNPRIKSRVQQGPTSPTKKSRFENKENLINSSTGENYVDQSH